MRSDARAPIRLHRAVRSGSAFAIELVDEGHDRRVAQAADFHQLDRALFDALGAVDHHQRRIDRGEHAVGVFGEVRVAGRVEQVDDRPRTGTASPRRHRNAALLFQRHPVRGRMPRGLAAFTLPGHLDRAAEQQQLFGQRGLAGVGWLTMAKLRRRWVSARCEDMVGVCVDNRYRIGLTARGAFHQRMVEGLCSREPHRVAYDVGRGGRSSSERSRRSRRRARVGSAGLGVGWVGRCFSGHVLCCARRHRAARGGFPQLGLKPQTLGNLRLRRSPAGLITPDVSPAEADPTVHGGGSSNDRGSWDFRAAVASVSFAPVASMRRLVPDALVVFGCRGRLGSGLALKNARFAMVPPRLLIRDPRPAGFAATDVPRDDDRRRLPAPIDHADPCTVRATMTVRESPL